LLPDIERKIDYDRRQEEKMQVIDEVQWTRREVHLVGVREEGYWETWMLIWSSPLSASAQTTEASTEFLFEPCFLPVSKFHAQRPLGEIHETAIVGCISDFKTSTACMTDNTYWKSCGNWH
jgi:hypothetical protein